MGANEENDYFIANGNPLTHSLGALENAPVGTSISFDIGMPTTINDAGTYPFREPHIFLSGRSAKL